MGSTDRIFRVLVALVIAALYFAHQISGITAIILLVLAGVFILTSFIGVCPLYSFFKISTCRKAA